VPAPAPPPPVVLGLNAVIVAVTDEVPRILVVKRVGHPLVRPVAAGDERPDAVPYGPLDPAGHPTLDRGLRAWVTDQTGLELGYVEQLYTFGDQFRDPREREGGPRVVSAAYFALVHEQEVAGEARWRDWYGYLPWEDWRTARPDVIAGVVEPALDEWAAAGPTAGAVELRRERVAITFGLGGSQWDPERVLERYELLYEAGLIWEAVGDGVVKERPRGVYLGRPMAFDHRRILATALGRVRGKIKYRPVVFELLPATFTLLMLQRVVEALTGVPLHKQNFRRLVEKGGLVEGTGTFDTSTGGRPAELFSFRRDVLRERPAPGVGLPGARLRTSG